MGIERRTPHPAAHANPTAKATSLAYLIFERPDLVRTEEFLSDFGLLLAKRTREVLYLRGTSRSPYCYRVHHAPRARFVGAGFRVRTREELERLARLDSAGRVAPSEHLGGDECVVLRDPSGFTIEVLYGPAVAPEVLTRGPLALNLGPSRQRINHPQRLPEEPADVLCLGHFVVEVANFQATCAWYTQHLGLLPSDVQLLPDGSPAVAFLRLDLGESPADHHTLAIAQGFMPRFGHAAFEVVDADAIGMGQRVLRERRWEHAWGIGRHILGSQLFDYWNDPWGDKHEHYCDGDLLTADQPMGIHALSREAMAQWGQPMPRSFTRPRLTPGVLIGAIAHLRSSPDVSLKKLAALANVFAR